MTDNPFDARYLSGLFDYLNGFDADEWDDEDEIIWNPEWLAMMKRIDEMLALEKSKPNYRDARGTLRCIADEPSETSIGRLRDEEDMTG